MYRAAHGGWFLVIKKTEGIKKFGERGGVAAKDRVRERERERESEKDRERERERDMAKIQKQMTF